MKTKTLTLISVSLLAVFTKTSHAQTVDTILNSANTTGNVTATHSITLAPGFSANGAIGSFSASIVSLPNCVALNTAPSSGQNYIATYVPRVAGITNPADPNNTTCQVMATVEYFDGLGRPLQTVIVKGSPTYKDLVQPYAYDAFGREAVKYLPYTKTAASGGSLQTNAYVDQLAFYNPPGTPSGATQLPGGIAHIPSPYSQTVFESSPLNRVLEQGAPGDPWQPYTSTGHTYKSDYATNDASSLSAGSGMWAKQYGVTLDVNGVPSLVDQGSYGVNELYVQVSKDENWVSTDGKAGTTEEYKDKEGKTVLSRVYNTGGVAHSTYYVFDDFGNVTYVIPATADPDNGNISQSTLDKYCYQYRYDGRQRLIEKKIPGKGREYMVYNQIDLLVATQDSLKRLNNQWAFIKYDAFGKPVITGIWNNGGSPKSRADLQTLVSSQTANWENRDNSNTAGYYYSNTTFPTSNILTTLTINYYDDYNIPNLPATYDKHTIYSQMTKGLLTVTLTGVLGNSDMLWSAHYYDDKGNIVKTFAQHYIGGTTAYNVANYDEISNTYDFTNNMTSSTRNHHNGSSPVLVIVDSLAYDQLGRKTQAWKQINGGANVLMTKLDYNEIGQLKVKHLHSTNAGSSFLQDINYAYNERGWMVKDSSSLFVMQLKYNDGTSPQYNGNIANQLWGTGGSLTRNYAYSYDKLNRLLSGVSSENFTEQNITYDKTGNILTLTRIDPRIPSTSNYTYGYDGNHLLTVSGLNTNAYQYDGNGNANYDAHNDVSIAYNILNLPNTITGSKTINYTYDADGNKLRRSSTNSTFGTVDYDNGIQYFNGVVDFIKLDEGMAKRNTDGSYNYEYSLADNLGNNRVSFDDSSHVARVIQKDDYYPYGLNYNRFTYGAKNNYLYNKKELQEELGQYDYGSRFYDPTIGRFLVIDKYAEKFQGLSTYQYAALDPIKNIDMNGDSVWTTTTSVKKGKDVYETRTTHITGKVISVASASSVSASDLAAGLNDKYNSQTATDSYKNKDGGTTHITYTMDAKFEGASSIKEVSKSDNLVAIVDKVEGKSASQLGGADATGLSERGGKVAYVQAGSGDLSTMTELAFHEVGHELGFDDAKVNNPADPMSYTGIAAKASFSNRQVIDIFYNASSGMDNQGSNRAYITNKQNLDSEGDPVSRSFSTNASPYIGDRRYGMPIPKPIINTNH